MFSSPKFRMFLIILGFVMICLFIWIGGPYFAFADRHPLGSIPARWVTTALLVVCWIAWVLIKRRRANRASDQLMAAVVEQSQGESGPSAEALQLRERFEEAVATLKKQRRSGQSLYDLPWYIIIGAPGSGKTTALLNSGLKFPVKQRTGGVALRGVGGTRDCDWWFTDEAVFLDTAGRYTTQDSDATADSAGWDEFMALLRKYRKRRPVNGVLLTISVEDLMLQSHAELEAHVAAARRRLDELNQKLRIQLPVYLLVTKCDLVVGFTEYFDDLAKDGRSQVWGVTFPYERTVEGKAARSFPAEFDTLVARLNARVFTRLDEEHDTRRRAAVFAFPQQMAALRDVLASFVSDVFGSTRFDRQVLLRGVYLTSGTQEGTPIDRLLGSIGRRFAVAPEAVLAKDGQGKAFFIERLLKQVLFPESGLAGVNRRFEVQKAAAQVGFYIAMLVVAVLGVSAFSASYVLNRNYVTEVDANVARLQEPPPLDVAMTLEGVLPRLDSVRTVFETANQYRGHVRWRRRWGLFQGGGLGDLARDAYVLELDGSLLPGVKILIEQRLTQVQEAEELYEYLKAYLMLGDPERLDKEQLAYIADSEWRTGVPDTASRLGQHFKSLLDLADTLRVMRLDLSLVEQARNSIQGASIPELMFRQLKVAAGGSDGLRLDVAAGIGADQVLRRRSGVPLSQPVSSLYTVGVFNEVTSRGTAQLAEQWDAEQWVWGEEGLELGNRDELSKGLLAVYERNYIAEWDGILSDIALVPVRGQTATEDLLARLGSPTSPLRTLLQTIDEHTFLTPPEDEGAETSLTDRLGSRVTRALRLGRAAGSPDVRPGTLVTDHFASLHQLVTGDLGLDDVLNQLLAIQQQLIRIGTQTGRIAPDDPSYQAVGAQIRELTNALRRSAAQLPPEVGAVIGELAGRAEAVAGGRLGPTLRGLYQQEVLPVCNAVVRRYPFVAGSTADVPLNEFGRVFGHGGAYDRFFSEQLETLVIRSGRSWTWRPNSGMGGERDMLRRFELAEGIRNVFFSSSAGLPGFSLTMQLRDLDQPDEKFVLEIGGEEVLNYTRGSVPPRAAVTWSGQLGVRFAFGLSSASLERTDYPGPWAWFRLVDDMRYQREGEVLTFQQGQSRARVSVETETTADPFLGVDLLRAFRCGS